MVPVWRIGGQDGLVKPLDRESAEKGGIELVVGKVFTLVWPPSHARFIGRPDVFESVPDAS